MDIYVLSNVFSFLGPRGIPKFVKVCHVYDPETLFQLFGESFCIFSLNSGNPDVRDYVFKSPATLYKYYHDTKTTIPEDYLGVLYESPLYTMKYYKDHRKDLLAPPEAITIMSKCPISSEEYMTSCGKMHGPLIDSAKRHPYSYSRLMKAWPKLDKDPVEFIDNILSLDNLFLRDKKIHTCILSYLRTTKKMLPDELIIKLCRCVPGDYVPLIRSPLDMSRLCSPSFPLKDYIRKFYHRELESGRLISLLDKMSRTDIMYFHLFLHDNKDKKMNEYYSLKIDNAFNA